MSTVTTLNELRALREKATPGKWEVASYNDTQIREVDFGLIGSLCHPPNEMARANAALIVALANLDLEKLLAEARLEEAEWWLNEAVDYPASESWIVARIAELRALAGSSGKQSEVGDD